MGRLNRILGAGAAALLLVLLGAWSLGAATDPTVAVTVDPSTVILGLNAATTCTVVVSGAGATPTGTVTWSGGSGSFSSPTCTLAGGTCSVTYTAGAGDCPSVSLTATYSGDADYNSRASSASLTVLRATTTTVSGVTSGGGAGVLLVNEGGTITVTVRDVANTGTPVLPAGTLTVTRSGLDGDAFMPVAIPLGPDTYDSSKATYSYRCTGLNIDGDIDTISVTYTPTDGKHAGSDGSFGQAVNRRRTETSMDCTPTATGCDCSVKTIEQGGQPGVASTTIGRLIDTATDAVLLEPYTGGPSPVSVATSGVFVNVSVKYDPTDRIHMISFASATVTRDDPAWLCPDPFCMIFDCQVALYTLNGAVQAAGLAGLILDLVKIIVDMTPDPVVLVTTVPTSDVGAGAIDIAKLALDAFQFAAEIDLDLDDIPGVIEAVMGMSDFDPDMDDDGLSDREEIDLAGGKYSYAASIPGLEEATWSCACPNPKIADSDRDGLNDGDELQVYFTDPCNPDTDGDLVKDGVEVATWDSADNRDHADPLSRDTDGDGISDYYEMPLGCLGTPDPRDGFVNSFDSDGDGLMDNLDAYADLPAETTCAFPGMMYVVKVPGSGDLQELIDDNLPSIADEDSDGDGLYDGLEHMRKMDFLDWDGDDDGRCDGHEVLGLGPFRPTRPMTTRTTTACSTRPSSGAQTQRTPSCRTPTETACATAAGTRRPGRASTFSAPARWAVPAGSAITRTPTASVKTRTATAPGTRGRRTPTSTTPTGMESVTGSRSLASRRRASR